MDIAIGTQVTVLPAGTGALLGVAVDGITGAFVGSVLGALLG